MGKAITAKSVAGKHFLYAGSFCSDEKSGGIGIYRYDPVTGIPKYLRTECEGVIAGAMCMDEARGVLYATDERRENPSDGRFGGRIFAFSVDPETGSLTELNHRGTLCAMPSGLAMDKTGKYLAVCHYSHTNWCTRVSRDDSGNYNMDMVYSDCPIVVFPLAEDGVIEAPCDVMVVPHEVENDACFHSIQLAPDGAFFIACALKQAKLLQLRFDYEEKRLKLCETLKYQRGYAPRTGHSPRYGAFHPTRPFFYFNSEYVPKITAVRYDEAGKMETICIQDVIPKIPGAEQAKITMSDLCINRDGRFLYVLYRLINAICVFRIDQESGVPEMIQSLALEGDGPRGLREAPDGRFILLANLASKDITTFAVNDDGTLRQAARVSGQEYPANLLFYDP